MLRDIDLSHLVIKALPPYVAIVDPTYWEVLDCIKCENLCTEERNFAMKVFLKHKESGARLGVANCHIPSTTANITRRKDTIRALCTQLATFDNLLHWIIGGDLNTEETVVKQACRQYLEPHVPSISRSGVDMTDARKADFAITRGINLKPTESWVGFNFPPHASDTHNMAL